MNIGMLWFDNDTKSDLNTKIERAASYYQNKYGKLPNLCFIHPSMAEGLIKEVEPKEDLPTIKAGEVEVRATRAVLPNHFWIGVNGSNGFVKQ
ncbi:MAG TPA: hypothetical protein VJ436_15090 [Anaerolineales bacterium]|nr:hypothetical protein [Anaerolineales bacterium]